MSVCLSVRQPFADLIVDGVKTIENRPRPTQLVGRLIIHSSQKIHALGSESDENRDRGMILGMVQLVGCHEAFPNCCASAVGALWGEGAEYHWQLAGARRFVTPFPAKGALGFWSPKSPSVAHLIELAIAELGA